MDASIIFKHFPSLSARQKEQIEALGELYPEWNAKINVVSRRDIASLEEHHLLHSLAIAKFVTPVAGTAVMDLGCGGGLPGLPLAVVWPHCRFHLIDRVGKKIRVATEIAREAGLANVTFQHGDAGECHEKFDFVVSRAVMPLADLVRACRSHILPKGRNAFPNGLICLKGGDLRAELEQVKRPILEVPLTDYFHSDYFRGKELVYVEM